MSAPIAPMPHQGVLDIAPYVPGKSTATGGTKLHKLSSNETPLGASPAAIAAYKAVADRLEHYPDGAASACATPSRRCTASIRSASSAAPAPTRSCTSSPTPISAPATRRSTAEHGFLVYPIVIRAMGGTPVVAPETDLTADVDAILALVNERTRVVFLANPNNPTGTYLPFREVRRLHAALAAARAAGARCGLCRICPPQRLRERHRACRQRAQRGDDAHLLEDLRAGRPETRLVLRPGAGDRRAQPHPRAVQRVGGGDRGGRGGPRRCRPCRPRRRAQCGVAAEGERGARRASA